MMKVEIRTASNMEEVRGAYDVAAKVFGPNYSQRKAHILATDNVSSPADVIIALDNSKIIGMLRIVKRQNYFLGTLLKSAGITNVCVMPHYQGYGIGRGLVELSLERIKKERFDISVVIARKAVDGFYFKYGYVGTGLFSEMILNTDVCRENAGKYKSSLETGVKKKYLERYAEIYARSYGNMPLAFFRPLEWWYDIKQKTKYKIKQDEFINVKDKNLLIGYFIYHDGKIIEAACFPKSNAKFCDAILQYLCFVRKGTFPELSMAFSIEHFCAKHYAKLNNTIKIRRVWNGGHMLRIINKNKIKNTMLEFIDKKCREFSKIELKKAKNNINRIFNNYDSSIHNEAAKIIIRIIDNNDSLVIKKIATNMQHTWMLLDEF